MAISPPARYFVPAAAAAFSAGAGAAPPIVSSALHFPPFTTYSVTGPFFRSPYSSRAIGPLTPWRLILESSATTFAGSTELAFIIASISVMVAS